MSGAASETAEDAKTGYDRLIEEYMASASFETLDLLPENDVVLRVAEGDGERFRRNWRAAWSRIYANDQARILGYWNEAPPIAFGENPMIVLGRYEWLADDCYYSTVSARGHRIVYRANRVASAMPDGVVQATIATDLARVCRYALGVPEAREFEFAEDARRRAKSWGFDPDSVWKWAREFTEVRVKNAGTFEVELLVKLTIKVDEQEPYEPDENQAHYTAAKARKHAATAVRDLLADIAADIGGSFADYDPEPDPDDQEAGRRGFTWTELDIKVESVTPTSPDDES